MNEAPAMIGRSDRFNRLRSIIRNLPAPAEFCLILFVGFAPLISSSSFRLPFKTPKAFGVISLDSGSNLLRSSNSRIQRCDPKATPPIPKPLRPKATPEVQLDLGLPSVEVPLRLHAVKMDVALN